MASVRDNSGNDQYLRTTSDVFFNSITVGGGNRISTFVEGNFTPTIIGSTTAGSPTYVRQIGRYRRINNRVDIQVNLAWSATTGMVGNLQVGNLPFPAENTAGLLCYFTSAQGTDSQVLVLSAGFTPMFHINAGASVIELSYLQNSAGSQVALGVQTGSIALSGQYFI